jgi:ferredoxin
MFEKLVNKIVKPSTLAFWKESRQVDKYSLFDFLHALIYGKHIYLYISLGVGEHPVAKRYGKPLGRLVERIFPHLFTPAPAEPPPGYPAASSKPTFADTYHGKVIPLEAARQLVLVDEDVHLPNLETIVPYTRARDLILKNPDHLVVLDCACRSARQNPCLPLDVCLVIGEPFASFVLENQSQRARQVSRTEALDILQAEDERGHVHHAFFKDAMLGRFYAICNCCACCCGAMNAHQHGTPMLAASGYLCAVDEELCIACGECAQVCQFDAIQVGQVVSQVSFERCMGCGVCISHCPQEALSLQRCAEKGEPLEILELMRAAADL